MYVHINRPVLLVQHCMSTTSDASSSSTPPPSILPDIDLSFLSEFLQRERTSSSRLPAPQGVNSDRDYYLDRQFQAERRTRRPARSKARLERTNNRGMHQIPISRDFFLIIILCFGIACAAICVTRVAIFARHQNRGNQGEPL
ncbi:hypothetical protein K443DRAFT_129865 [Laccaria amethystina LaAM-08-1]|uniref:Uncharacterized protein n=1 Tax=Laccaria amethystina LaAM-08-1 TaxID=1095629 RepID=A0A0C9XN71_9AGAR|nr:hypothetical protein K443DRAFT_129865 [Laccaria amethystina LaAM-08-1]